WMGGITGSRYRILGSDQISAIRKQEEARGKDNAEAQSTQRQEKPKRKPKRQAHTPCLGQPAIHSDENVQGILSDRGFADGLDSVCAEGGGGNGILPAAWGCDLWSDAGSDCLRSGGG